MKRLIRDILTGRFLTPKGDWTKEALSALDLLDISAAIAKCDKLGLRNVEYVLQMEDFPGPHDVTLPLGR